MTELNEAAAQAARAAGAHAMTDVTGFGLLGHLHELALASGVAAEVDASAVPAIEGALELLADERAVAGGSRNNRRYAEEFASFATASRRCAGGSVTDAMTSGGLLVALDPARALEVPGTVIGRLARGRARHDQRRLVRRGGALEVRARDDAHQPSLRRGDDRPAQIAVGQAAWRGPRRSGGGGRSKGPGSMISPTGRLDRRPARWRGRGRASMPSRR